ncbi:conserved hypothetical protein [Xanthomonas citri pv. citri]|nr:conserved hypothetical protein [Xanthomonas citri pv. citri]
MSYTLQPVPADVLAVLRAVADDVLRASRRLSARLKRALARVLALPIALLALATGAHAAEPSLSDALECRLPAAQAESVLADYGIAVDAPGVQFGTLVTAYDIPVMKAEATRENGALHVYYVIVAEALRPFIDAAGMDAVGNDGFARIFHERNGLMTVTPAIVRKRASLIAPIHCEMRA